MNILITGASGFVGANLCPRLLSTGHRIRRVMRSLEQAREPDVVVVRNIDRATAWDAALKDVDVVVHLAGMAHSPVKTSDSLRQLWEVNVAGTARLAEQATAMGVKRLVYLSSVKVNGEETISSPYTENQQPLPRDPYGASKFEAEQKLFSLAERTALEVSVIRPALVYGPRVKGNVLRLLQWIDRGLPVPVPNPPNRRSLVGISNLVGLIECCVTHLKAAGEVFLAGDGEDVSSEELVRRLARALGRPARIVRLPARLTRSVASLLGKEELAGRLFGSLQVDASKARRLLDWQPASSLDDGLVQTVAWFRSHRR